MTANKEYAESDRRNLNAGMKGLGARLRDVFVLEPVEDLPQEIMRSVAALAGGCPDRMEAAWTSGQVDADRDR